MSSELVVMVSYQEFEESIELISAQIGKQPAQGDVLDRWLEAKFHLIRHLPAKRWSEMVPVAFNTWRFWNEFSADWVQTCSAELARLEQAQQPPPVLPTASPCPAWLGIWLARCRECRTTGQPPPTVAAVQEEMRERGLDPKKPSQSLNQLIVQALCGATLSMPEPQKPLPAKASTNPGGEIWA